MNIVQSGDGEENVQSSIMDIDVSKLEYEDKWILSKLNTLIKEATANLDNFDMGVYAQKYMISHGMNSAIGILKL